MQEPPKPPQKNSIQSKPRLSLRTLTSAIGQKVPPPVNAPVWTAGGPPSTPTPAATASIPKTMGTSIDAILRRTAPPWVKPVQIGGSVGGSATPFKTETAFKPPLLDEAEQPDEPPSQSNLEWENELAERDRLLRRAKAMVDEKERAIKEQEMLLEARERYLRESERLLAEQSRQLESVEVAEVAETSSGTPLTDGMRETFENMKAELDRREEAVRQAENLMRERENFVQESEHLLFEKAQQLQEMETGLESLKDELAARRKKLDKREGISEPAAEKEIL
ncbi:MAG: hypothetical protein SFY80_00455 [Verrucomicrobiota bacterium]|nr:hypothetical protein [Verrucomicrobiota bacterium]